MKKQLLILAGLAIFNTCFSQTNYSNNQVLGGGNNSAIDFDGVDDKITTPIIFNSTFYANWTIECWAKSPSAPGGSLGYDGPMYADNSGIIWNHGTASFRGAGTVQAANGTYFAASFGTLAPNTWYHLAVTYDGTLLKAYKNGNLITTTTTTGGMTNGTLPLIMGKHPIQAHYWEGTMDNARVWAAALTCEQISERMNNNVLTETDLISGYTFNEGVTNGSNTSLTAVQNSVTSTSDATLSGFTLTGTSSNFIASAPFNLPPICVTETASGLAANCLSFTGTNDIVVVQNTVPLTDYTIECNVLLKDLNDQNIIVATDANGTFVSTSHQIKLVNGYFYHYMYDGNLRILSSNVSVNINQWYHVSIFVQANNIMGITVNGTTDYYPTAVNTPWQGLTEFRFGGPANGVGDFNGKLDEVRIWDRVLCYNEIQHYSNCEVTFPSIGLRSVFHFNQGVDGADNSAINTLSADNSSLVGALLNFGLNGNSSNWDDAGIILNGNSCGAFTANCNASALDFDGVDDNITLPTLTTLQFPEGTLEAWIKTSDAGANFRGIVCKEFAYGLFLKDNKLASYNWSAGTWVEHTTLLNDNNWHHVALTFKNGVNGGSQLYLDGVAVGAGFTHTIANHNRYFTIGTNGTSGQNFNGEIDGVRIWNRSLCASEISNNKDCAIPAGTANLKVQYHFNQGFSNGNNTTVLQLNDSSGNSIAGNLINFSLLGSSSNFVGSSTLSAQACSSLITDITESNGVLSSVVTGGGNTYQWTNCAGTPITSETGVSYTPSVNDGYMVNISNNGCTTPSECYTINSVGISENEKEVNTMITVYPNPAKDKLNVKAEGQNLKVFNSLGVVVLTASLSKNEVELQVNELSSGVYHIVTDLGAYTKFIKQ